MNAFELSWKKDVDGPHEAGHDGIGRMSLKA
ncbi:hypothetical protein GJW-30_1_03388 [Variibacter gotjawalensis]|uniref:Uncharacterized protein n=1 Tax=Variibacter gotjawalensis TaxID=1333996 RepID=A0A0S3PY45_9BRAD|nr:hypothetical protein [Variibacter gotjawalensis]RZS48576.1 hypothetical protein EV661_0991 [Variibacter gotjawalensis]BAT60838.1 hypothetical protein GJW-30_1_03388 [Variibacter gotjawalensis]